MTAVAKRKTIRILSVLLLGGVIMFGLFGCKENTKKYKVDYCGAKSLYTNAKDEYTAGEEVELCYPLIATDTDYSFYLDGERLNYDYEDGKGFVLRFTMPEHDVKLEHEHHNSMEYVPPTQMKIAEEMLIDYYSATVATVGGDGYDETVLYSYTDDKVKLITYHEYEGEEETKAEYIVPYEVVDRCYEVIEKYKLREWNDRKDTFGITGALLVCRFKDGDGYVRVSSEKMPDDGKNAFNAIDSVLGEYIKDEYRVN